MDFKEKKLKEFKDHIFNKTFSRDERIYWGEVESFLRKALEEQEKDFDKIMETHHDNYFELKRRLSKEHKKVHKEQEELHRTQIGAWHTAFGSTQLTHAIANIEAKLKEQEKRLILNKKELISTITKAFYDNGYGATPTVCPECHVDDFTHIEGCSNIGKELDIVISEAIMTLQRKNKNI